MHRFFVPPAWITGDQATLRAPVVHQIRHVLRMKPGDHVILLDNSGWEREVKLTEIHRRTVRGKVVGKRQALGEPRTKITLYQSLLKGKNFEWALQKGTELGVVQFVPLITSRCVVGSLQDTNARKQGRWARIIAEAAEQSGRGRLPSLLPAVMFDRACEQARKFGGLLLIPWEQERETTLKEALDYSSTGAGHHGERPYVLNILTGPEGGFTEDEVALARRYGAIPITLGPRILRAETAGVALVAAILYELGDWAGV
ncbi:MAG: 16S rRNA (uracil(1498)-N(3))-methyltransferase [Chloroflexi bacterium]|nr:16S rRNA (uracil(1498)-N(3))-methyltransferase [Chloroflexota bacterium]